jgi:dipeptidase E
MRQIIAIGGGGFSAEPGSLAENILGQSNAAVPSVCFIPTANGDADAGVVRFYDAYNRLTCKPSHLSFFRRTPDFRSLILAQDVVFIGGGNTKSMLAVWREWGLPDVLNEALDQGVVFAGGSAGAICWFEQGVTDSWADALYVMDCLALCDGAAGHFKEGELDKVVVSRRSARAFHVSSQEGVVKEEELQAEFL